MKNLNKREGRGQNPKHLFPHDAELYFHVLHERKKSGDKTIWLLTLDTSLSYAAKELQLPRQNTILYEFRWFFANYFTLCKS